MAVAQLHPMRTDCALRLHLLDVPNHPNLHALADLNAKMTIDVHSIQIPVDTTNQHHSMTTADCCHHSHVMATRLLAVHRHHMDHMAQQLEAVPPHAQACVVVH